MKINKITRFIFLVAVLIGMPFSAVAQEESKASLYPKVGEICPEFTINEVYDYSKNRVSKADFKGQWLVLYFWSRWCTTSMTNFPKLQALQKQFDGQVTFLTIGKEDAICRDIYREFQKHYALTMPHAFQEDIGQAFGVLTYPHILAIDPEGMVRSISVNISEAGITRLIEGKESKWMYSFNEVESKINKEKFNRKKPFLSEGNGGLESDVLYRSVLMPWKQDMPMTGIHMFKSGFRPNEVLVSGADLSRLYKLAYGSKKYMLPTVPNNDYGNWWHRPILEVEDTTVFGWEYNLNAKQYAYSLIVPQDKSDRDMMRTHMQRDLDTYFGYEVIVENRMMPYWSLKASQKAKKNLISKGGTPEVTGDGIISSQVINQPISKLIHLLWGYNQNGPPFIDETGITTPIDISLKGILIDLETFRAALKGHGLYLEKGKKLMKVIVIRDKT